MLRDGKGGVEQPVNALQRSESLLLASLPRAVRALWE